MFPKNNNNIGFVIEIKKYKGNLSLARKMEFGESAIAQIETKEYYCELLKAKVKNINLYALIFDDNGVKVITKQI